MTQAEPVGGFDVGERLRTSVLLQPRPELGTLMVRGADRQSWLNGLVTCDLVSCRAGDGAYGLCVSKVGKILAELWIAFRDDALALAVRRDLLASVFQHLERHVIMENIEILDDSANCSWLFAYGHGAAGLVPSCQQANAFSASLDWTGLGGVVVGAPPEHAQALEQQFLQQAPTARTLTPDAWDALRIEAGIPEWGDDFNGDNYPQEASLERRAV